MPPRFFVPNLDPPSGTATVEGTEARHMTRVLRLGAGDEVSVFDGRGREYRARVDRISGSAVVVRLVEAIESPAERQVPITLAQAVLKGSSMDDVVRDAAMMGVAEIVPLVTAHTVATRAASPHGAERWRRVAIASAKQCRLARVPDVASPLSFEAWLRRPRQGPSLLLVEPTLVGIEPLPIRALLSDERPSAATLVIGPEGGWSVDEVQAAINAGLRAITLGPLTLRAETVALATLAALTVVWE